MSALAVLFHFLVLDVLIEFRFALLTFWQKMEADTTDVLTRFEILRMIDLVALYFELHHAPAFHTYLVASAQVLVDNR